MVPVEDFDELSRLLADELPEDARARLEARLREEPELRAALEGLRTLDIQVAALPLTVSEQTLERVMPPAVDSTKVLAPRRRRWPLAVGALAVAAALLLLIRTPVAPASGRMRVLEGVVLLDGAEHAIGTELPFRPGQTLEVSSGGAAILTLDTSLLRLVEGAQLQWAPNASTPELSAGLALATGEPARLTAAGVELEIRGEGVVAMEPVEGFNRVTQALSHPLFLEHRPP